MRATTASSGYFGFHSRKTSATRDGGTKLCTESPRLVSDIVAQAVATPATPAAGRRIIDQKRSGIQGGFLQRLPASVGLSGDERAIGVGIGWPIMLQLSVSFPGDVDLETPRGSGPCRRCDSRSEPVAAVNWTKHNPQFLLLISYRARPCQERPLVYIEFDAGLPRGPIFRRCLSRLATTPPGA